MACEHCQGDHWNNASKFPTPGCPVIVRLEDGSEVPAIRPRYVSSYDVDPEYKTDDGEPLRVVAWRYR